MMQLFEAGIIRDTVLFLNAGIIFYALIYALYLIIMWLRNPIRSFIDVRLAWSVFLNGLAINAFGFLVADLYGITAEAYLYWVRIGYIAMMFAIVGFFFAIENILPYKTKKTFSLFGFIFSIVAIFTPQDIMRIMAIGIGILAFLLLILFFKYLRDHTTEDTTFIYNLLFTGFLFGFIGFILRTDPLFYMYGPSVYLLGIFFLLVATLLIGSSLMASPTLDELDWFEHLLELYIIGDGGILQFHHRFHSGEGFDEKLVAAGFSGIQEMSKEITQSEGKLDRVRIGTNEILFSHGLKTAAVLVCGRPYRILLEKLREYQEKFELVFETQLDSTSIPLNDLSARLLLRRLFSNPSKS